jgi:hypothetical protein
MEGCRALAVVGKKASKIVVVDELYRAAYPK